MQHKSRLIIISIAIVIVIAALVTALLVVTTQHKVTPAVATTIKNDPAKDNPANQESLITPDLSKDLGACTAISKDTITSALGSKVESVGNSVNLGYAGSAAKGGDGSQTCVFPFSSANALNNRYSTTVTLFATADSKKAAQSAYSAMTKIDGIGDAAYFETVNTEASAGTAALHAYNAYVFSGGKLYTLTISQPTDSDTFTSTSAQEALTTIAKSMSL